MKGAISIFPLAIMISLAILTGFLVINEVNKDVLTIQISEDQISVFGLVHQIDSEKIFLRNKMWVASQDASYNNLKRGMWNATEVANHIVKETVCLDITNVDTGETKEECSESERIYWRDGDVFDIPSIDHVLNDLSFNINSNVTDESLEVIDLNKIAIIPNSKSYSTKANHSTEAHYNSKRINAILVANETVEEDSGVNHILMYTSAKILVENIEEFVEYELYELMNTLPNHLCNVVPPSVDVVENIDSSLEKFKESFAESVSEDITFDFDNVELSSTTTIVQHGSCSIGTDSEGNSITAPIWDKEYEVTYVYNIRVNDTNRLILSASEGLSEYPLNFHFRNTISFDHKQANPHTVPDYSKFSI